jgi:hypothetical protein
MYSEDLFARSLYPTEADLRSITTYCDKLLMLGVRGCEGGVLHDAHYEADCMKAQVIYKDVTYDILIKPRGGSPCREVHK